MNAINTIVHLKHWHMFCGLGGGAKGFNKGQARVGSMQAEFVCIGGVDVDPASIRDFTRAAGVEGTVLDLFDREQYTAFHGKEPPAGWREATPDDIRASANGEFPDIVFLSAPCKGFSGLLPEASSKSAKYQALNKLTLRGVWLMLEAFKENPPGLIIFENVPRIMVRGRPLLDQIHAIYRSYGYDVAETTHDCGRIGGLGQSRKRFLMVARHRAKVPPFLYEPPQRRLRGVGEILEKLPLPGDMRLGPMHKMPALQWKTWVRLAFVEAGSDWRSLNKLSVADGFLTDFGIMPDEHWNHGVLGVVPWDKNSGVVSSRSGPTNGNFAVADPRGEHFSERGNNFGVTGWVESCGVVTSQRSPGQGKFAVADPRIDGHDRSVQLGVGRWDQAAAVVKGDVSVGTGRYAVPDPRHLGAPLFNNIFRIVPWGETAPAVAGPGGAAGGVSVADPRLDWNDNAHPSKLAVQPWDQHSGTVSGARFLSGRGAVSDPRVHAAGEGSYKNSYDVTGWDDAGKTVTAGHSPSNGGHAVADPRPGRPSDELHGKFHVTPFDAPARAVIAGRENGAYVVADPRPPHRENYKTTKYRVTLMNEASGAVISASTTGNGAFAVADPRPFEILRNGAHGVREWDETSGAVAGESLPSNGAFSVADPRPIGLNEKRDAYETGGHYGVMPWETTSMAVPGYAKHDRGRWSVADPRDQAPAAGSGFVNLPKADDRLVAVIRALDGTWHRPFTTLELAALQSLIDPDEVFELDGASDSAWRERIGNAVPPDAAAAIASVMGTTLLLARTGETFALSSDKIWVAPLQVLLAVDHRPNDGAMD